VLTGLVRYVLGEAANGRSSIRKPSVVILPNLRTGSTIAGGIWTLGYNLDLRNGVIVDGGWARSISDIDRGCSSWRWNGWKSLTRRELSNFGTR